MIWDVPYRETIVALLLALFDKESDNAARVRRFVAQVPTELPDGAMSDWEVTYP